MMELLGSFLLRTNHILNATINAAPEVPLS
jgi:hypothetical protein